MNYIVKISGEFERGECYKCPLVKKEYGTDVTAYVCYFRTKEGRCPLEEVKQGEWKELKTFGGIEGVMCSECGYREYSHVKYTRFEFCPKCGKPMKNGGVQPPSVAVAENATTSEPSERKDLDE